MYFLLIAPNQKKQKVWQEMLGAIKPGDKVTTSGGLRGTVLSVRGRAGRPPRAARRHQAGVREERDLGRDDGRQQELKATIRQIPCGNDNQSAAV